MVGRCVRCSAPLLSAAAVMAFASRTRAEATSGPGTDRRPAFYLQAGFSPASPHVRGAAVGGSLLVGLNPRLAVEGSGMYMDRGAAASAASLTADLLLNLASRNESAVPYLLAGGGLFRAWFDTRNARFSGPAPTREMGRGKCRHVMEGQPPGWDLGDLPPFYSDRVEPLIAQEGRSGSRSFNDPALSVGAGVRIRLGRSWSARQDARALLLVRSGRVYPVWVFTIHLGRGY